MTRHAGGFSIKVSYKLYYQKDGEWVPVQTTNADPNTKDKYIAISFEAVKTIALKMEIQLRADFSRAIHEWNIK